MQKENLTGQIHSSIYNQLEKKGFATPVDLLMDIGVLSKEDYTNWRLGKIDYLERVCKVNLHKLSEIMKEMRRYGSKNNLKQSFTVYKQWECKTTRKLRFSKRGNEKIEEAYASHYLIK